MLTLQAKYNTKEECNKEEGKKKTIGEILAERASIIREERRKKVDELFGFVRNLYMKSPDLMYLEIRVAEVSEKMYPAMGCRFFDRKGHEMSVPYSVNKENLFADFEGDDYDKFVSSLSDEGLSVAVATEEKVLHNSDTKCVYLCIYPSSVSLEDYTLKKAFDVKVLLKLDAEKFYDLVSEDAKFVK